MSIRSIKNTLLLGLSTAALTLPTMALAQNDASDQQSSDKLIIVTASKRETTLQETPIAVSVTSAEQIEQSVVRDLFDIQTLVPSLRVGQRQDSGSANFIIRGFGNGGINNGIEPSVGVFIDGVYRSRSAAAISDLPNVERIEVLRGPQSTLFGKNASSGIISVVTKPPQFELGGSTEISYGNLDALILKADITGPLSETVAASLSGSFNRRDGYVEDINLGFKNNERNRWAIRGQLLFEPTEDLSFRMIADYDRIDEICCSVVNIVDGPTGNVARALGATIISNDRFGTTNALNFAPINEIDNFGVSLHGDLDLDGVTLSAIAAYRGVRSFSDGDTDFTNLDSIRTSADQDNLNTYTVELRAASDFDGPINFLVGGFLFKEDIVLEGNFEYGPGFAQFANAVSGGQYSALEPTLRALIPTIPAGTFGDVGQGRMTNFDYNNSAISLFGQLDLEIVEGLTFTVGANFTHDEKDVVQDNVSTDVFSGIDLVQAGVAAGVPAALAANPAINPFLALRPLQFTPPFLNFPNAVEDGKTKDNDLSYTFRLAYDVTDNVSSYVTYATGFKASSFNLSADSRPFAADFIPGSDFQAPAPGASPIRDAGLAVNNLTTGTRFAGPEEAVLYEIGIKGQWQGVAVNLAIFDQTLNGFQDNVFTGTGFVLGNAEKQSVRGFEVDGSFSPVDGLTFTAALTYLDSKYDSFTGGSAFDPGTLLIVPTDLSGQRPAGIPEWSGSIGGTYSHLFDSGNKLTLHADYFFESETQLAEGLPEFTRSVNELNASATFELANGLAFTIWGRNLTKDIYNQGIFPTTAQSGSLSGFRNFPRTYGASVKFRF